MPRKKVQKDVKSIDLETQSDLNEGVGTKAAGKPLEPISVWEWAKKKGDSPYVVSSLKIVKPQPGKPLEGTPYYVNNRMVGYLVVK